MKELLSVLLSMAISVEYLVSVALKKGSIGVCVGLFSCSPKRDRKKNIHKHQYKHCEDECYTQNTVRNASKDDTSILQP